jgi:hypothetical protein
VLACPFCGTPESDRVDLEGKRFIVFGCQFTPEVDPAWDDGRVDAELRGRYGASGSAYFRGVCDRLHRFVTKGEGARALLAAPSTPAPAARDPAR